MKTKNPSAPAAPPDISIENIQTLLGNSGDIVARQTYVGQQDDIPVGILFIDGLVNGKNVDDDILKPLIQEQVFKQATTQAQVLNAAFKGEIYHYSVKMVTDITKCITEVLEGAAALIFEDEKTALVFSVKGFEKRSITEPSGENIVKGAKDSLVENIRVNTATIRTKIKNQNLRFVQKTVGKQTQTAVSIVYLEGVLNPAILAEVEKRIDAINHDGVVGASSIEEYLVDKKMSLFPQVDFTERADKLCANIVEGYAGILIDGMPFAYIAPATLPSIMQAPEDYALNYLFASVIRIMRYISLLLTLILPAYYVSISTFHMEMIPSSLAIAIINSKQEVPFPPFIEVLFMLFAFELLIEAGVRMPKTFGQAVSIVGAIVVGQAAVSAKFLSPAVIVVISLVGIAGFAIPNYDMSNTVRVLRFLLILCAAIAGLVGMTLGIIAIIFYMATLKTFGVAYLSPLVGSDGHNVYKDTIIRMPLAKMKVRPGYLKPENIKRRG